MSSLTEELRTVRLWRADRAARKRTRAEERDMDEEQDRERVLRKVAPAAVAARSTEGHDPDPDQVCTCGDVSQDTYREHLIALLGAARLLRVPGHVVSQATGEGW